MSSTERVLVLTPPEIKILILSVGVRIALISEDAEEIDMLLELKARLHALLKHEGGETC